MKHEIIKKEIAGDVYYGYYEDNGVILSIHNEDGPAVIWENGTKEWWINGNLHKEDGPAIIYFDGTKEWWVNGNLHNEDGPAKIYKDGTKEWWVNHTHVSTYVRQWLDEKNLDPDNLSEEDQLALSFYMRSL